MANETTGQFLKQCADAMVNYQHLTQDKNYGAAVKDGKMRLTRVTYDARGKSTVQPCGPWILRKNWLQWLAKQGE